ncbi:hypothetical protein EB809_20275 [Marinobacter sp. R17]|uniref:hypothetical protein n=1 Tax=Marinobacter sp. R17 TaxID=2484250 RepID=UPI000F4BAE31|nr:hypothetical protein [Marinobacter sp. R17]ROT93648.1 hypothetical protein EB809_20275 [Marinobacter sp. R17]
MRNHLSSITPIALAAALAGCQTPGADTIRQSLTLQSPTGESMEAVQVLEPNPDGSYTLVALEPEAQVNAFYDRACQADLGPTAHYVRLEKGTTVLSKGAITAYSCETSEPLAPDQ